MSFFGSDHYNDSVRRDWDIHVKDQKHQKLEKLLERQEEWCPKILEELKQNGILSLSLSLSPFCQHKHTYTDKEKHAQVAR